MYLVLVGDHGGAADGIFQETHFAEHLARVHRAHHHLVLRGENQLKMCAVLLSVLVAVLFAVLFAVLVACVVSLVCQD